jgi:hypothetical protein
MYLKVRSIDCYTKIARVELFVICFVDEVANLSRELDILSIENCSRRELILKSIMAKLLALFGSMKLRYRIQ